MFCIFLVLCSYGARCLVLCIFVVLWYNHYICICHSRAHLGAEYGRTDQFPGAADKGA
jgi:hypothetical protein